MSALGAIEPATVVLTLPASAAHVRTARLVAAAMARRSGIDEALLDEVRLAVGEACARAVRLHERYGLDAPVTVEFGDRGRFSATVIDSAPVPVGQPWTDAELDAAGLGDRQPATVAASSPGGDEGGAAGGARGGSDGDNLVRMQRADGSLESRRVGRAAGGPEGRADAPSAEFAWVAVDSTADVLGLALLDAVVQDLDVSSVDGHEGTRVSMSWPLDR